MPVYRVKVRQYFEEVATFHVEAKNKRKAKQIAAIWLAEGRVDNWQDGDDVIGQEVSDIEKQ